MLSLISVRIRAMHCLYTFFLRHPVDGMQCPMEALPQALREAQKQLHASVRAIHRAHALFLQLVDAWALLEEADAARMITPHPTPLNDDPMLTHMRTHPHFIALKTQYPIPFSTKQVAQWYHYYYEKVTAAKELPSPSKRTCLLRLIKYLFKTKKIRDAFALTDPLWHENQLIVYQRLRSFEARYKEAPERAFALYQEVLPDKKVLFYTKLIEETLSSIDLQTRQIRAKVTGWDIKRIHILDQTLIRMALTEIFNFPEVPKQVTIYEYVEIAKKYSDKGGAGFINAVVDSITR